ncbi:MAG TPA: hypothetical protein VMY39_08305, partial [Planctomycetota bacterium]|nr:hypothetical protein [Planctomycetota bacterium]
DPDLSVIRDRKHLDTVTATPLSFHNVVLARAAVLGLTVGKPDEKQLRAGEEALNRWAVEQKLTGTRVAWTLRVDAADDTFAGQHVRLLDDQLAQDQENLTRYQRQRDSILGGTADPELYRTLGKQKTLEQLRSEIVRLNERVPELTRELWDARLYTVAARLGVPGRDDLVVRGDFHKDDKLALQAAVPDRALTISGNVRRIRCDLTPAGKVVFPVELARCRLANR